MNKIYYLSFASHKFAADVRRERCRCISILQTVHNEADAEKSCDFFSANKSRFLRNIQVTHLVENIITADMLQMLACQLL